jgi:hypothetical protein
MTLRMTHERWALGRRCKVWPRSQSVDSLIQEFNQRMLRHLHLDARWKDLIMAALRGGQKTERDDDQRGRLLTAHENLRKEHKWGHITHANYLREWAGLDRQIQA